MTTRKFPCRKCGGPIASGNRFDLCKPCRSFQCVDCGKQSVQKETSTIRCGSCHTRYRLRGYTPKNPVPQKTPVRYGRITKDQSHPEATEQLPQ